MTPIQNSSRENVHTPRKVISMERRARRSPLALAISVAVVVALAGCAPGGGSSPGGAASNGPVSTNIASSGKVTLTVWDQNVDGGIAKAQKQLNSEFTRKYPNVTIKRVTRAFKDLKTTLKLALSSKTPPDVVQANQGYSDMGAFVKAGLIRNVDGFAKAYGWDSRYPSSLLDLNRFTSDGQTWHRGDLYGVSQTGELVGVFFNRSILNRLGISAPKTIADLEAAMAKAESGGIKPISYGSVEKFPGIHLYGVLQNALAGKKAVRNLAFSTGGKWTDSGSLKAAQTITDWVRKGYLDPSASGISTDAAAAEFGKGDSAFYISGTWQLDRLTSDLGDKAGFVALNGAGSPDPETMGGEGLAWAMTTGSKHPDVAGAYIDFITNAHAAQVLVDTDNLPAVPPEGWSPKAGTLGADIAAQWKSVNASDGLTPYLDYTTPTFYDTLSNGAQDLLTGQKTAQQFADSLQADYTSFQKSRG